MVIDGNAVVVVVVRPRPFTVVVGPAVGGEVVGGACVVGGVL
jgi:hypothetical protein